MGVNNYFNKIANSATKTLTGQIYCSQKIRNNLKVVVKCLLTRRPVYWDSVFIS